MDKRSTYHTVCSASPEISATGSDTAHPVTEKLPEAAQPQPEPAPPPTKKEHTLSQGACRALSKETTAALNFKPSLSLGLPVFGFFVAVSVFLDYVVATAAAHIAVFFVGSYIVGSTYFVCDYCMSRHSTSYARIPDPKKFYVLSNLIKSAVLLSYSPLAAFTLYEALVRNQWHTQRIRNLGVLYAMPDFVSLFLVSKMARTTQIHHVCVVVFMVVNLYNEYGEENVCRALVVYAIFSTFAYLVNLLLASRFQLVASLKL
jgi:hypothetical protein